MIHEILLLPPHLPHTGSGPRFAGQFGRIGEKPNSKEEDKIIMTKEEIMQLEGRVLDAAVGKALGFEPRISWWAMDKEEQGVYITFNYKGEAEEWDKYTRDRFPKHPYSADGGKIVRTEVFKHYSSDISAAWEVYESVKNKRYWIGIEFPFGNKYRCLILDKKSDVDAQCVSESITEAICKAALLAAMEVNP